MGNEIVMAIGQNNTLVGQKYYDTQTTSGYNKSTGIATPSQDGKVRGDEFHAKDLYAYFDRSKKSIADYLSEYQNASNYNYYKNLGNRIDYRYRLIDLYEYGMQDLHLTSIVDSLFHQIVGERYSIKDAEGKTLEDATKLIKKGWFTKYVRGVLESKLYGYTLIELGDLDTATGSLKEVRFVERRNVAPKDNLVLEFIHDSAGWDITSDELKDDYVLVDGEEGFGWMLKALPIVMSKRFALSSHTQYAETYGIPMIVGKTTDDSYEEKKSLANDIAAARDSRVIVTGLEDDITFLNQISNDTNKIYTELVRLTNDELTMLVLGQSATTESQAYAGSAEIQYRVMVDRVEAIREFVQNNINEDLIWRLREKGMDIPEGATLQYSNVLEMSPEAKKDLFEVLLGSYEVAPEEIYDTFGVTVGRQILEESNDQLLTYEEETVKERGNPDGKISKDPEQAEKDAKNAEKEKKKAAETKAVAAGINFFDTIAGCDLDVSATEIEKSLRKLDSKLLSDFGIVNDITNTYRSSHTHVNDVVAALSDDQEGFQVIIDQWLSRIFAGDASAVSRLHADLTQKQYNITKELFGDAYGIGLDSLSLDSENAGYKNAVSDFLATFSASKQHKLVGIIVSLASTYNDDYETFVLEATKANSLFNKTYHVVEGETMRIGYEFASVWRSELNDEIIFEYGTQKDAEVRDDHSALSGVRMRKSEWAKSSFLPPWAYNCRCFLINTGTTDGRQLTKSRKLPSEDTVPVEFRTNVGESGAVFSRQHPYYKGLSQSDGSEIRKVISGIDR